MLTKLWMQKDVIQVEADTTIGEVKEIINQHCFRHLPVTSNGTLLGIITETDINRALPSPVDSSLSPEEHIIALQAKVSSFMTENPLTVYPLDSLITVVSLLRTNKIGAIPVVEEGKLVGIITESDIFDAFSAIMDGKDSDVHIELQITNTQSAIYKLTDLCKRADVWINSLTIYRNFCPEHQLVTLRVNGDEIEPLIDALWNSGMKISQISGKSVE
jgi:acetoin utilization protein AcuB